MKIQTNLHIVNYLFIISILTSCISPVEAKTYNDPNLSISINIDNSFSRVSQSGNIYYFTAPDNSATVIIKNQPGLKMAQVKAASRSGYRDSGIILTPRGKPAFIKVLQGSGISIDVVGSIEQNRVIGKLAGFIGNKGQGFIILIAATPKKWPSIRGRAHNILKSIRFVKPKSSGGSIQARWQNILRGKRVAYRFNRGGISDREDYYLCSNGTYFEDSGSSAASSDAGGVGGYTGGHVASVAAVASNQDRGRWRIQMVNGKAHIVINSSDGEQVTAALERRGDQTFIGGKRYFILDENSYCR